MPHEWNAPAPYAKSKPIAIETIDLDAPGPGEVLVRIGAAGLCHSDLSVINGRLAAPDADGARPRSRGRRRSASARA